MNRIYNFAGFILCTGLLGFGLYLQHVKGLEPCPLCILQRIAFIALAVTFLVAALHNPRRKGAVFYYVAQFIFAAAGAIVAGRQVWLQTFPSPTASCGADLSYMMETLPSDKLLGAIFRGTGDCSEVVWRFLGLSIPAWALLFFVAIAVASIVRVIKTRYQ